MAYKPARGSYEIDRIFRGLGRVRLRTGVYDKRLADRYEAMLEGLPIETVRLVLDDKIPLRAAFDAWSAGQAHTLPTMQGLRPLVATMKAWAKKPPEAVSDSETDNRDRLIARIEEIDAAACVADLPTIVKVIRRQLEGFGATFNRQRAAAMAFLRDDMGPRAALYLDLTEIPVRDEPPKYARHPCTVQEARVIARELGSKWGPVWWALCCHGLGPKEYWHDGWKPVQLGLEIFGQKWTARHRVVPLVVVPPAAPGTKAGFAEALERADLAVTPYDARRSYARWLDEIGAPDYLQDAFMGHGKNDMRSLYKWGDITAWLNEYGRKLRKHVGEKLLRVAK